MVNITNHLLCCGDHQLTGRKRSRVGHNLKKTNKSIYNHNIDISQTTTDTEGTKTSNYLADGTGFAPAVVEGGPRRCQSQTLSELVPLPGHLAELEQDGI